MLELRLINRFPFTIIMVVVVCVVAALTGTHWTQLHPDVLQGFGFAPRHLPELEWFRLITSAVLTHGGFTFYAAIAMLIVGLGWAERAYGSWRTAAVFWGVHLVTLLTVSLAVAFPLHWLDFAEGTFLVHARDVGPSAGYYGCLGLACATLPRRYRWAVIGGVVLLLIARMVCSWAIIAKPGLDLSADAAHLLAFPLGVAMATLVRPLHSSAKITASAAVTH